MNNHLTLHAIRSCVYSKVHNFPFGGKLDDTGKFILRQHSYKHTKVHTGTYCQVSLVHKKHSASESEWLCIFVWNPNAGVSEQALSISRWNLSVSLKPVPETRFLWNSEKSHEPRSQVSDIHTHREKKPFGLTGWKYRSSILEIEKIWITLPHK